MNAAWQNASQEMYAASGAGSADQTGGSQPGSQAPPPGGDEGGVSDVEYEEVDDKKK
jgi:molecular chaperone DnaK